VGYYDRILDANALIIELFDGSRMNNPASQVPKILSRNILLFTSFFTVYRMHPWFPPVFALAFNQSITLSVS
jgi:hypothetical protein